MCCGDSFACMFGCRAEHENDDPQTEENPLTRVSILIPFGVVPGDPAGEHRQRLWDYLRPQWDEMCTRRGWELIECTDQHAGRPSKLVIDRPYTDAPDQIVDVELHPWSTARALRQGMTAATGDVIFHYGADHLPDERTILAAIAKLEREPWTMMYEEVTYASQESTLRILAGSREIPEWAHTVHRCIGMWGFRRSVWDAVGGVDPRFVGWGYGDDAFSMMLTEVFGPCFGTPGRTLHELWHPGGDRVVGPANPNERLWHEDYLAHAGDRAYFVTLCEKWTAR